MPVRDDDAVAAMSAFALLAGAGPAEPAAEPERTGTPPLALVAPEGEGEEAVAVEAEFAPEPVPEPVRPRLGLGSFADLRSTPVHPPVVKAAEPASASVPDHPELDAVPSQQESYAAVADAVGAATGRSAVDPSDVPDFTQDLLPKKLPKRGRRASKLQTPWARERPAKHADSSTPSAPVAPERSARRARSASTSRHASRDVRVSMVSATSTPGVRASAASSGAGPG